MTGLICSIVSYIIWGSIAVALPIIHDYHIVEDEKYRIMHQIRDDSSDNLTDQDENVEVGFKGRQRSEESESN